MRKLLLALLAFCALAACTSNVSESEAAPISEELIERSRQVDTLLQTWSLEQKIGQLLIVQLHPDHQQDVPALFSGIQNERIGGLLLHDFPLDSFRLLTQQAQQLARTPLWIATTEQFFVYNQFANTPVFPTTSTLLAMPSDSLREVLAQQFVKQSKELGINLSFQHSPTPTENFAKWVNLLDQAHIMAAGQFLPEQEFQPNTTTTSPLYANLLRKTASALKNSRTDQISVNRASAQKQFDLYTLGLDALQIKTASTPADALQQLRAGADMLVVDKEVRSIFEKIRTAVRKGQLSEQFLDAKVHKILLAKAWVASDNPLEINPLPQHRPVIQASLALGGPQKRSQPAKTFSRSDWQLFTRKVYEESIILARNANDLLPFTYTYNRDFHWVSYGEEPLKTFSESLERYAEFEPLLFKENGETKVSPVDTLALAYKTVVLTLDRLELQAQLHKDFIHSVNRLGEKAQVALVNFGNPLNLSHFDSTITLVQIFERTPETEDFAAQLLFGSIKARGKLPLTVSNDLRKGHGITTSKIRLKYTIPEEAGIAPERLVGIDAIANAAIRSKAFPGCQVVVAKSGKVIYDKAFGYHTYREQQNVRPTDLYDIASITKVAATTMAAMKLYDEKKLELSNRVRDYIVDEENSKIQNIRLQNLFTHHSGLQPQMPIYSYLRFVNKNGVRCDSFFCTTQKPPYTIEVAEGIYMREDEPEAIWKAMQEVQPKHSRHFRYSDLNFNILQKLVEEQAKMPLDKYVMTRFYNPMGLRRSFYKPLEHTKQEQIVPTAYDNYWRKQTLRGYVHDESAALLGGVAGNAGLFSTAQELTILFQMLLDKGVYGGRRYLYPETIDYFTENYPGTDRGLGFDKVRPERESSSYAKDAPASTFGHTGFTGTCAWADPDNELVFVFLSNRIHPNVRNKKIYQEDIRSRMHQVIYDALDTYEFELPAVDYDRSNTQESRS